MYKKNSFFKVLVTIFAITALLYASGGCSIRQEASGTGTAASGTAGTSTAGSKSAAASAAAVPATAATGANIAAGNVEGTVGVNIGITNNTTSEYNIWLGNNEDLSEVTKYYPGNLRFNSIPMKAYGKDRDNMTALKDTVIFNAAKDGVKITTQKMDFNRPFTLGMIIYINWDGSKFTLKE